MTTSVSTRTPGTLNPTRQQLDELDALLKRMLELPVNKGDDTEERGDSEEDPVTNWRDDPIQNGTELASVPFSSNHLNLSSSGPRETKVVEPPMSYVVVETASPRPLPPASGFEPQLSGRMPRVVPVTPVAKPTAEEEPSKGPTETPSAEADVWVPLRSTWKPSAQTWQPLADNWHQANGTTPTSAAMPAAMPSPRLIIMPPAEIAPTETPKVDEKASSLSAFAIGETPAPSTPEAVVPTPTDEPRLRLTAEDAPVLVAPPLLPLLWFNQGFDACLAPLGALGRWLGSPVGRQVLGIVGLLSLAAAVAIVASAGMGWTW